MILQWVLVHSHCIDMANLAWQEVLLVTGMTLTLLAPLAVPWPKGVLNPTACHHLHCLEGEG